MNRLLTADEISEQLCVPRSQVYRLAREGVIPHLRLGKYVRFDPAAIERWIDSQDPSTDEGSYE